jgi:hypothetical protein
MPQELDSTSFQLDFGHCSGSLSRLWGPGFNEFLNGGILKPTI